MTSRLPHMRRAAGQASAATVNSTEELQSNTSPQPYQQQQQKQQLQQQQYQNQQQRQQPQDYFNYSNDTVSSSSQQSNGRVITTLGQSPLVQQPQQLSKSMSTGSSDSSGQARRSSKSQTDSIPHPTLKECDSIDYLRHVGGTNPQEWTNAPFSHQYFATTDKGNAGPRFIRPTTYSFANEPSMMLQLQIPQGCVVQPFTEPFSGEQPPPIVPFFLQSIIENGKTETNESLFRCTRCHSYVNPFFKFIDGGNTAVCNLCSKPNKVPNEYYSPLNSYSERNDKYERPELCRGVYDLIAPSKYPRRDIQENLIMICLEMTPASIQSGVFAQALCTLQMSLAGIPTPERTFISICTYGSQLHFYSIPKDLNNDLQLIVIADLEEPFCPFPKNAIFLNVVSDKEKIDYFIEKLQKASDLVLQEAEISKIYSVRTASIGSIVQSVFLMLEEKHPARIIAFTSQLPSIGFGKLKRRDDAKLLNTDLEKSLYIPSCKSYVDLSKQLLKSSISVDLFVFAPDYCDLTTISLLSTETGGSMHYFPNYTANDAEKIHYELYRNLTRTYNIDCLMTLRTSPGIILEDYYTAKGKISVRDLHMSHMHAESVIAIAYKQEEKITGSEAFLQYACLYTGSDGQSRIRVINLAVPVHSSIQNIFKLADLDSTFSLLLRKALNNISTISPTAISDQLIQQVVSIFYSYRNNCAASSSASQLILPESIKYLIVYILSVMKTEIFKKQQAKPDARFFDIVRLLSMPANQLSNFVYPKIYPIHTIFDSSLQVEQDTVDDSDNQPGSYISDDRVVMPHTIPCSLDRLASFGVYLIDNGETIFAYVQKDASPELLESLFGVQDYEQLRDIQQFPALTDNFFATKVNAIIDQIRRNRNGAYQNIKIVLYKDPFEPILKQLFIEDDVRGVMSYNNFICDIHKRIQQKYTS